MKISVCIATYNGAGYVRKQLDSILQQLGPEDDVIVPDDSSADNTIDIIKSIKDKRIVIYNNNSFASPILNFENALKHAQGDVIFLSDQDDIWVPSKVQCYLEQLKEFDLVFSNVALIDESDTVFNCSYYKVKPKYSLLNTLLFNKVIGATVAFKRGLLDKALPFPSKIPMHDQWLAILASYYGRITYIEEPMLLYRRHGNNASYSAGKSRYSFMKKMSFRFNIIQSILYRIICQ